MYLFDDIKRHLRNAIGPLVGAAVVIYFCFHMVQGDRGLMAWVKVRQDIAEAEISAQEVAAERADLEHRVSLLKPESLDLDMLEERARVMLGMARKDDIIIQAIER